MKKILTFALCLGLATTMAMAQQDEKPAGETSPVIVLKIGYVHSAELLNALPERKEAQAILEDLSNKYKMELQVMQGDYNKKYSDFMTYQNTMGENIKLRRMQELYELEKSINNFIKVSQDDIEAQEKHLLTPLRQRVARAIEAVGIEQRYVCIYDKADTSLMFVMPQAVNLNDAVRAKLAEME